MSDEISKEDRVSTFEVVSYLDDTMSAGRFPEVDAFLGRMDVEKISNPSYLLACCNYVFLAKERGDILMNGPAFRARALARLRELVGNERAEKLLKNR